MVEKECILFRNGSYQLAKCNVESPPLEFVFRVPDHYREYNHQLSNGFKLKWKNPYRYDEPTIMQIRIQNLLVGETQCYNCERALDIINMLLDLSLHDIYEMKVSTEEKIRQIREVEDYLNKKKQENISKIELIEKSKSILEEIERLKAELIVIMEELKSSI